MYFKYKIYLKIDGYTVFYANINVIIYNKNVL